MPILQGKTAFITGGAKNLGALIAADFAAHGARAIAIHYHSEASRAAAEQLISRLKRQNVAAFAFQADLSRPEAMAEIFAAADKALGGLDIAVNTVGKMLKKPILAVSEAEYDTMTAVNAKAAFFFLQQAGRHLRDNGAIITLTTSLLGAFAADYSVYAGAKAAVEHYIRAAAKEFGLRGISVNSIAPGPMDTPFFYDQESAAAQAHLKKAAALSGRSKTGLTDIADIIPYIRFLATEGWWMSGQTVLVNGGFTTK